MSCFAVIPAVLACAAVALCQTPEAHPSFDAASVKPANVTGGVRLVRGGGPGTADPGRFTDSAIPLANLVRRAYGLTNGELVAPGWMETQLYAVALTMPPETTADQFRLMLQDLLADRFSLKVHRETRDVTAFALVAANGGIKLKKWLASDSRPDFPIVHRAMDTTSPRGLTADEEGFPIVPRQFTFGYLWTNTPTWLVRIACRGCTMADFIQHLETPMLAAMWFDETLRDSDPTPHLVDRTGITGKLNFNLEFADLHPRLFIKKDEVGSGKPFAAALEKQLGIRLSKMKKVPMGVLVVDGASRTPTAN